MGVVEANISMSLDGFVTGPNLTEHPGLGEGGEVLHAWLGGDQRKRMIDETFGSVGAVITSRKVYELTGGWGEDGFYRMPVFVITHRAHDVVVKGETTFNFVTDGVQSAIEQAKAAAGDKKVHVMGGASVIQQALQAKLVDELAIHLAPVLLGAGTPLFDQLDNPIELEPAGVVESQPATHLRFRVLR